jgi:hypothetical protein
VTFSTQPTPRRVRGRAGRGPHDGEFASSRDAGSQTEISDGQSASGVREQEVSTRTSGTERSSTSATRETGDDGTRHRTSSCSTSDSSSATANDAATGATESSTPNDSGSGTTDD